MKYKFQREGGNQNVENRGEAVVLSGGGGLLGDTLANNDMIIWQMW